LFSGNLHLLTFIIFSTFSEIFHCNSVPLDVGMNSGVNNTNFRYQNFPKYISSIKTLELVHVISMLHKKS
jgi:hypothetical protein